MIQTNTEYMSDMARVERIVQKFMNMTLKELKTVKDTYYNKAYIEMVTDEIIRRESLSAEKAQDMSYIELACLIYHVGSNPRYDWNDHDSWAEQQFYFVCVAGTLIKGRTDSIPIKMFMELPLKAFYDYMASIPAGRSDVIRMDFDYLRKYCKYREDYTIGDFLFEKNMETKKSWHPYAGSLEAYGKKIKATLNDIGILLVSSFRLAFPDGFGVEDICSKYRDLVENECEDLAFDDDEIPWTETTETGDGE